MKDAKTIDVKGIRTRYFEAGRGDPMILIHGGHLGGFANAYDWSRNFDGLAAAFHVYALDKIGQGHTDNPATDDDYTMGRTIEHVRDFVVAVGARRAVLVGHSRGALPAARIAVDHPELVSALVLVDSNTLAADHPSTPTDFYAKLAADPPDVPDERHALADPRANSYSQEHITHDYVEAWLTCARLPKVRDARSRMERLEGRFRADLRARKYETLDRIRDGALQAPTLVVWGLNDPSAPIILGYQLFQQIAFATGRAQLHVFNRAGHYVYREHPADFTRLVTDFVHASAQR